MEGKKEVRGPEGGREGRCIFVEWELGEGEQLAIDGMTGKEAGGGGSGGGVLQVTGPLLPLPTAQLLYITNKI